MNRHGQRAESVTLLTLCCGRTSRELGIEQVNDTGVASIDAVGLEKHIKDCRECSWYLADPLRQAFGPPQFISLRRLAEMLDLSTKSAYRMVKRGEFPHYKLPTGVIRGQWDDVDRFLGGMKVN